MKISFRESAKGRVNDYDSRIEKILDEAVLAVYSLLNGLTLARVKA